jgi:hypothetical protein
VEKERAGGINGAPSGIGFAEPYLSVNDRSHLEVQHVTGHDARLRSQTLLGNDGGTRIRR